MKCHTLLSLFLLFSYSLYSENYKLKSPDGKLEVGIDIDTTIRYTVKHLNDEVVTNSTMALRIKGKEKYSLSPKVRSHSRNTVNKTIQAPFYKRKELSDHYNELTIRMKGGYGIAFRAYDEAIAYRFFTELSDSIIIDDEIMELNFSSDRKTYAPYVNSQKPTFNEQLFNSFENLYDYQPMTRLATGKLQILPVLVELDHGKKLCFTEADLEDYPGTFLLNDSLRPVLRSVYARKPKVEIRGGYNQLQGIVAERENFLAKTKGIRSYPWRILAVSENDARLADMDIVYKLASPTRVQDFSWINPGKVAWDWWNNWNVYGVDFKVGINTDTYKYYVDFAAKNGLEYVILDEGWFKVGESDLTNVIPDIDLPHLIDYAARKNVGIILWAGYYPFYQQMDAFVKHFADMGVKGFKIDFLDRDDQDMLNFMYKAADFTARHKMLIDFHGVCKPTGLQRTYPNIINYEGVFGLEQMKWNSAETDMMKYDVTMPFIRMVAGPVDYTAGAMTNATRASFRGRFDHPMSQGTRCHQLATYVVFESPLNMLCDSPSEYEKEPAYTSFLSRIPTVWEDTKAIDGKVGEYIVMARKKDDCWYVGALTNWDPRQLSVSLDFLPAGNYSVEIMQDGINADKSPQDYASRQLDINANQQLTINMAPGGGYVAKITPKP